MSRNVAVQTLKALLYPAVEWVRHAIVSEAVRHDDVILNRLWHVPHNLFIHPTNACNARCVFCSYTVNPEKKIFADTEVMQRAIDQWLELRPSTAGTVLDASSNNGDPLLDPQLIEKLTYAKSKGVQRVWFSTNGILLGKDNLAEKLVSCTDAIGISIPGFDREDYRRVFGVDKAEAVLEGLIKLATAKRAARSSMEILLQFRIDRPFAEVMQDPAMARLKPYLDDGTITIPDERIRMDELFTWGNVITDEQLPGTMRTKSMEYVPTRRPCRNPFIDVAILPDGQVRVCSCQYMKTNYDELVIGDVRKQPLSEILFGKVHRDLLRTMAEGRWPEVCINCSIYQSINFTLPQYMGLLFHSLKARARKMLQSGQA